MGRWTSSDLFKSYLTNLPMDGLLCHAGYSEGKDSYYLPRSSILPPESLRKKIFPWADRILSLVHKNNKHLSDKEMAAVGFLKSVIRLRVVLLQDLVMLDTYIDGYVRITDIMIFLH